MIGSRSERVSLYITGMHLVMKCVTFLSKFKSSPPIVINYETTLLLRACIILEQVKISMGVDGRDLDTD